MSRPPLAREKVLDAFEALLVVEGARAATMDATAKAAGVSKGGLLYHFASKDALAAGIMERLVRLVDEDVAGMASAPDGPVAHFLRTSVMENDPLDRVILATARLAQGGSAQAADALRDIRERWAAAIRPAAPEGAALDLVMLVSDGIYFNNSLAGGNIPGPVPRGPAMEALIALVERAIRS